MISSVCKRHNKTLTFKFKPLYRLSPAKPKTMQAVIPDSYKNKPLIEVLKDIVFARFDTSKPPCTHSLWPNIVCALSNIFFTGIPALYRTFFFGPPHRFYLTLAAILSSTIYHLSEVKSELPGLPYLRKHASWLIQVDRLFAIACMGEVIRIMLMEGIKWNVLAIGAVGLFCGVMSEYMIGWKFVGWHSMWHNAAFAAIYLL